MPALFYEVKTQIYGMMVKVYIKRLDKYGQAQELARRHAQAAFEEKAKSAEKENAAPLGSSKKRPERRVVFNSYILVFSFRFDKYCFRLIFG